MNTTEKEILANVLKNLKEGMVIKNCRELSNLTGIKYGAGGGSRVAMLEEFERYFSFERYKGNSIIVKSVYESPLPKTAENSYFDGFLGIFEYLLYMELTEKAITTDNAFVCLFSTSELLTKLNLYNHLWSQLLKKDADSLSKYRIYDYNEEQMNIVYEILESDSKSTISNILSNSLKKLSKNYHAHIHKVLVNKGSDTPVSDKTYITFMKYYTDSIRKYGEPLLAWEQANKQRNKDLGIEESLSFKWRIIMGPQTFKYFSEKALSYSESNKKLNLINEKRIKRLTERFTNKINKEWKDKENIEQLKEATFSFISLLDKYINLIDVDDSLNITFEQYDYDKWCDVLRRMRFMYKKDPSKDMNYYKTIAIQQIEDGVPFEEEEKSFSECIEENYKTFIEKPKTTQEEFLDKQKMLIS